MSAEFPSKIQANSTYNLGQNEMGHPALSNTIVENEHCERKVRRVHFETFVWSQRVLIILSQRSFDITVTNRASSLTPQKSHCSGVGGRGLCRTPLIIEILPRYYQPT